MFTRLTLSLVLAVAGAPCALAQLAPAPAASPLRAKLATVTAAGEQVAPGDMLRTTRIFPNWNLNCEVQLSKHHHLCAVEQSVLDPAGNALLAWSVAIGSTGEPVLAMRTAPDLDKAYGVHLAMGPLDMALPFQDGDCNARTCLVVIPFDATLRAVISSQSSVRFTLKRNGTMLAVDGPVAGMAEALAAARTDPIGLLAVTSPEPKKTPAAKKKVTASVH
jgi:invasion protein IalB